MGSADSSISKVAVCTGFGSVHSGFLTPSHSIAPGTFEVPEGYARREFGMR